MCFVSLFQMVRSGAGWSSFSWAPTGRPTSNISPSPWALHQATIPPTELCSACAPAATSLQILPRPPYFCVVFNWWRKKRKMCDCVVATTTQQKWYPTCRPDFENNAPFFGWYFIKIFHEIKITVLADWQYYFPVRRTSFFCEFSYRRLVLWQVVYPPPPLSTASLEGHTYHYLLALLVI